MGGDKDFKKELLLYESKIKSEQIHRTGFYVIVFGILTFMGFGILIYSLGESTLTGALFGQREGNIYGGIIIIVFLIVWVIALLVWHFNNKRNETNL